MGETYGDGASVKRAPGEYPSKDKVVRVEGGVVQMGVIVQHLVGQTQTHYAKVQAALQPAAPAPAPAGDGSQRMEVEEKEGGEGVEEESSDEDA